MKEKTLQQQGMAMNSHVLSVSSGKSFHKAEFAEQMESLCSGKHMKVMI